jgi:hypothetical protein
MFNRWFWKTQSHHHIMKTSQFNDLRYLHEKKFGWEFFKASSRFIN